MVGRFKMGRGETIGEEDVRISAHDRGESSCVSKP